MHLLLWLARIVQGGAQAGHDSSHGAPRHKQQQQQQQQQRRGAARPGQCKAGGWDIERRARADALALVSAPQDVACMLGLQVGCAVCMAAHRHW